MAQAVKENLQAGKVPAVEVDQKEKTAPAVVSEETNPYPTTPVAKGDRVMTAADSGNAFKKALSMFRKSVQNTMEYARICAELSILHFEQHGDLVYAQAFLDAMPKNFVRRAAYLKWLANFSPVTMTQGKLTKDKRDTAVKFDTDGALAMPFWDFAPDPEDVVWGETDVVKLLRGSIRKLHGENYVAKDEKAIAKLAAAEAAIEKLA